MKLNPDKSDDLTRRTPDCITFAQLAADALTSEQVLHVQTCPFCQSMRRGKELSRQLDMDLSCFQRDEATRGAALATTVGATVGATVATMKLMLRSLRDEIVPDGQPRTPHDARQQS